MNSDSIQEIPNFYEVKLERVKTSVFNLYCCFKVLRILVIIAASIFGVYLALYERKDITGLFIGATGSTVIIFYFSHLTNKMKELHTNIIIEGQVSIATEHLDKMSYFKFPAAHKMSKEIKQFKYATESSLDSLNNQVNYMIILSVVEILFFLVGGIWFLLTVIVERMQ